MKTPVDVDQIHVLADLHLGAPMTNDIPQVMSLLEDALQAMRNAKTSALVFAGDLFDKAHPRTRWYAEGARLVRRALSLGFRVVVLLEGNHDVDERSRTFAGDTADSALDVLRAAFEEDPRVLIPSGPDVASLTLDGAPVGLLPHPYRRLEDFSDAAPSVILAHFAPEGGAAGADYTIERGVNVEAAFGEDGSPRVVVAGDLHTPQELQLGAVTCVVPGSPYPVRMADVRGLRRYITIQPGRVDSVWLPSQWSVVDVLARLDALEPDAWGAVLERCVKQACAGLRAQADLCNVALRICLNLTLAISARHLSDADAFVESVRERYDALRVTVTPQDLLDAVAPVDEEAAERYDLSAEDARAPLTPEERLNGYLTAKIHEPEVLEAATGFVEELLSS